MAHARRRTRSASTAPAAASRGRRRTGFTLFELMIVLSVMAIMAAMAVPRYANSVGRYRAESAARRVAADLVLARAKARAASAIQTVTFNTTAGTYTVSGVKNLDHPGVPYTVDLAGEPYHVTIGYADFGGAPQAQFDMYGAALWSGTVKVQTGDFVRTVKLVREDGTITVQ